jgi:hypothetical protein
MKKAIILCLILLSLSAFLFGCRDGEKDTEEGGKIAEAITDQSFSSPFSGVNEGDLMLSDDAIRDILSAIPSDRYEVYPDRHIIPLSATLYDGNKVTSIDINDPRLITLINFYNNSVYHGYYSYTQGVLSTSELEATKSESKRLVLTYAPYGEEWATLYDTIIVTEKWFVAVCHGVPAYDGVYPNTAFGHIPLYYYYDWLELLDF